jgi:2-phosphosulfolactate phosphatase
MVPGGRIPIVRVRELAEGARRAAALGDVVIVVDALRASATIACALACGAVAVRVVAELDEARTYLRKPGTLVAGERGGAKPPDLDLGNSPTEFLANASRIRGAEVVLTTSNGTRCLAAAAGAAALFVGSLPNLSAVARAAMQAALRAGRDLSIVAAGEGGAHSEEDQYAAGRLASAAEGMGATWENDVLRARLARPALQVFLGGNSAARLTGLGYADDVRWCAQQDVLDVAPVCRDRIITRHA